MERLKAAISKAKTTRGEGGPRVRGPAEPRFTPRGDTPMMWNELPQAELDTRALTQARVVTESKENPAHIAFDILRTKLLKLLERNEWTSIAITSPTQACGKTMISTNLAFSFARQKTNRVVLCDVDLKRPAVRKVLGAGGSTSMGEYLSGNGGLTDHFRKYSDSLAVCVTNQSMRHSAEVVQAQTAFDAIDTMKRELRPHVIIYDLPPMRASDDAISFMSHVDCVLLIASAGISTVREIDDCESQLSELTHVAGVVLNKYDVETDRYYDYDYYG
ncbi:CpsD/CapB family tyrosine-protein kinase [Rhodovulum sp. DZ06]|uniref:CpsD/CapB family tyrosine-protein kinase n=1 Tax=Rhodovulum sp. DZ06 TaxID=3425126 RepID=UPI003D32831C